MYLGDAKTEEEKEDLAMLIEEMLNQRILGVKNEAGAYVSPAFPKLIYVLEEDNIHPDSKYYYLTELAAKCVAKRMVPDFISEKKMKELKVDANGEGHCFSPMGCRSMLNPYLDENGKAKFWGRFNQGVCTINLPNAALASGGDFDKFWELFDERTELCYKALMTTHNKRLKGTKAKESPQLWMYGALARKKADETIDDLLCNGYSTMSLGYAGLAECVKYMTGHYHHEDPKSKKFALEIMHALNAKCEKWKKETTIAFGLYGTPIESTTYKFAKANQRYGIIEGVTDKNYVTNSYHIPVHQQIDAFSKLKFESEFQDLSTSGAISYVEVPNLQNNIDAVLAVMKFIYDNIVYGELNTKSDYCMDCGFDGEIKITEDENKKLIWRCPKCGSTNQERLYVARRTCGLKNL